MDKNQEILVKLLSGAIRGREPEELDLEGAHWKELYEEAKAHEVYTLIFPAVKKLASKTEIDKPLLSEWERTVLYSGMLQLQHIQRMGEVFERFSKEGIPVIALKGLVVRDVYPSPELRTMSDADILVKPEDIEKSKELLTEMGYQMDSFDNKHLHFSHSDHPTIELHKSIVDYNRIKTLSTLEDSLWQNAVHASVGGVPVLAFSPEDQVLHLCLHMISHIMSTGFGLRQMCDLVLMVEAKRGEIPWEKLFESCKTYGIHGFVYAIFHACSKLFEMKLPPYLSIGPAGDMEYIDLLVEDIFSGGVYGRKSEGRTISNLQMHFSEYEEPRNLREKILNLLKLTFPSSKKLGNRYLYAKKYPLLAPVAWIHRIIWCIIRRDLKGSDKRSFLLPDETTRAVKEERTKLLRWLQLR
jgi:hypothetical protein